VHDDSTFVYQTFSSTHARHVETLIYRFFTLTTSQLVLFGFWR